MHSLLLIVVAVLVTLYALAWRNQPAQEHEHKSAESARRKAGL